MSVHAQKNPRVRIVIIRDPHFATLYKDARVAVSVIVNGARVGHRRKRLTVDTRLAAR